MSLHRPPLPGTARIALAALVVVGMVMGWRAYESTQRWWLLVPAVVVVLLLGWWRGVHLTTIAGRRAAIVWRNRRRGDTATQASMLDPRTTVLLRVVTDGELPLPTIARYLHRYGIRSTAIRVTRRDTAAEHTTWIGVTVSAAENLEALQARSPRIPLHETADVLARRMADQLRELGWTVHVEDADNVPAPVEPAVEHWRGVRDDRGHVAAYRVTADDLAETLTGIRSYPSLETWTSLEMTGDPARPAMAAACALRTAERPGRRPPVDGLIPHAGRHRPALARLSPLSTARLE